MTGRFDGRTAVVTGGAQGIGAAIVRRLVSDGARVLVADRNPDRGEALATELGDMASYANVDVTERPSVAAIPEHVRNAFGADMDLLVCNAGIQTFHRGVELPVADWDRVMDVNARGMLLSFQTAAWAMQPVTPGTTGAPAIVATELWDRADKELSALKGEEPGTARTARIASVPLQRAGTPEDVAASVGFLLSDDASYITGECLHVCGGDVML